MNTEGTEEEKSTAPLPECATMAIGTVPHTDPVAAVDFMIENNPLCPTWPQLPRADFRESMYIQYAECMPAVVVDEQGERSYFDVERAPEEMAVFYEQYFEGSADFCGIGPEFARGLHEFLGRKLPADAKFIKGQVTGPASYGLTVTDTDNKPVLYHADLFEAVVKALALKGRWQVERFRETAPGLTPIVFYDEPYLTQVGSALISLSAEQVTGSLEECYAAIDGLTGTHVCGGTDWGLLASTGVDILHFDAADHSQEFFIYEKEIADFLARGGWLAWGIVPNNERAEELDSKGLVEQMLRGAEKVAGFTGGSLDAGDILKRSFISEACGTGTLSMELAGHCFRLAVETSYALREQL